MIDLMFVIGGGIFIGGMLIKVALELLAIPKRIAGRKMRRRLISDLHEAHSELEQLFAEEENDGKGQTDKKQNSKVRPKAQGKSQKTSNKS